MALLAVSLLRIDATSHLHLCACVRACLPARLLATFAERSARACLRTEIECVDAPA